LRLIEAVHMGLKANLKERVGLAHDVGQSPTLTIVSKSSCAQRTQNSFAFPLCAAESRRLVRGFRRGALHSHSTKLANDASQVAGYV
jgi:hypothetical protein